MAHYSNGQSYYGQPNNSQQPHPTQYGGYPPLQSGQGQEVRRTSSFDAGDDAPMQAVPQHTPGTTGGYTPYGSMNHGSQHYHYPQQSPAANNYASFPVRTSSQGSSLTGYTHQYSQPPPSQPTYNPSLYGRTQSVYNPQVYSAPNNNYNTPSYQPYNPAAYQSPPQPQSATFGSQPYTHSSVNYGSTPSYQPQVQSPTIPQRANEQAYAVNRRSTYYGDYAQDTHDRPANVPQPPGSAPLPPRPSAYSPPVPSPPNTGPQIRNTFQTAQQRPHSLSQSGYFPSRSTSIRNDIEHMAPTPEEPPPPSYTASEQVSSNSFASRAERRQQSQQVSPEPLLPTPPAPQMSPLRSDSLSHPRHHPLPPRPPESESDSDYFDSRNGSAGGQRRVEEEMGFDDLMKEVESAVMSGRPSSSPQRRDQPYSRAPPIRQDTTASYPAQNLPVSPDERHTHTNGTVGATGTGQYSTLR